MNVELSDPGKKLDEAEFISVLKSRIFGEDYTVKEIAEMSGVHPNSADKWKNGSSVPMPYPLYLLAFNRHKPICWFFGQNETDQALAGESYLLHAWRLASAREKEDVLHVLRHITVSPAASKSAVLPTMPAKSERPSAAASEAGMPRPGQPARAAASPAAPLPGARVPQNSSHAPASVPAQPGPVSSPVNIPSPLISGVLTPILSPEEKAPTVQDADRQTPARAKAPPARTEPRKSDSLKHSPRKRK